MSNLMVERMFVQSPTITGIFLSSSETIFNKIDIDFWHDRSNPFYMPSNFEAFK